jgi:hypothetical protein
MTRRSVLGVVAAVLAFALAGCRELGRYHSRVKFSLSTKTPTVGKSFEASIDYMDETEEPCAFVLLRGSVEVDRATLAGGEKRVSLTAREPGEHSVEFRWSDRMIAHGTVMVRE